MSIKILLLIIKENKINNNTIYFIFLKSYFLFKLGINISHKYYMYIKYCVWKNNIIVFTNIFSINILKYYFIKKLVLYNGKINKTMLFLKFIIFLIDN